MAVRDAPVLCRHIRSALAVVLIYPLLLGAAYVFVLQGRDNRSRVETVARGALFGAAAYGVYNLTNMATLPGYSWDLVVIDVMWGAAVFALLGGCAP